MVKIININDNITLNYIPMSKLKTTSLSLYIHRDLNRDDVSKNAILPHILKHGCRSIKTAEDIAKYLDNLYGARFSAGISKRGDEQILCFDFETIEDKYAPKGEKLTSKICNLMMSLVFDSPEEFNEKDFEQERKNSIMKIKSVKNDKRVYANYRCQEEMAKGDKFEIPRLGYVEDMEKLTAQELYQYYKEMIFNSPIDIFVCGKADIEEIERVIKEFVSKFEFKKAYMPLSSLLKHYGQPKNIKERMNVTQGKLSMGFLTGIGADSPDYFPLVVANAIYGGGAQSKLFNNVREKLSLAYYAGSFIDKYKGFLIVNAGIEFDNYEKAFKEILYQLEEMKNGNITELEFTSSKGFLINSLNSYYDDQHSLISFCLGEKIGQTNRSIDECKAEIERVTLEDVKRVMSEVSLDTVYFLAGEGDA